MADVSKIPPKSEWRTLSIYQLYDVRAQMSETYFTMRRINASFAAQYLNFVRELDALIQKREAEAEAAEKDA